MNKIIFHREETPTTTATVVRMIGEGHYAITQQNIFNKKETNTVYLLRSDLEAILKEEEINLTWTVEWQAMLKKWGIKE